MLRLRHAEQITGDEANEIVLLNSHNGTSSYQMLAGVLRFVCQNGMVAGDDVRDIRVPHKGNVVHNVINGAFDVPARAVRRVGANVVAKSARNEKGLTSIACKALISLVGARGFEPPTTCTPCRYATRLRYAPNSTKV